MSSGGLESLRLTEILVAFAVVLQTIEMMKLRDAFSESGIWRWSTLRTEFPSWFKTIGGGSLGERGFLVVLGLRLLAALLLIFKASWILSLVLVITTYFISLRWLGTFNGGSDYMTFLILYSVIVARFFENNPRVVKGALLYIAIQCCLSYFVAGITKLRHREWRSGQALKSFLEKSHYETPDKLKNLSGKKLLFLSWSLIIFECGFPLSLRGGGFYWVFIGLGLSFHVGAYYAFGLNRFFFAWLASYAAFKK